MLTWIQSQNVNFKKKGGVANNNNNNNSDETYEDLTVAEGALEDGADEDFVAKMKKRRGGSSSEKEKLALGVIEDSLRDFKLYVLMVSAIHEKSYDLLVI